mmetsp:Transcript_12761/g.19164  ORF Transcript_12761/g.19164 Transcript_12761/m.19164 type:complete len:237 (-) Transcript_12761:108-818(-)
MGTNVRGWLVFVYKDNYHIIWNNNDSYPSAMGQSIVAQIIKLIISNHGDVQMACNNWGNLLSRLSFATEKSYRGQEWNGFYERHAYDNIEQRLQDRFHPVKVVQTVSSSINCNRNPGFVQYHWEINLDKGSLMLYRPFYSTEFKLEWSFKSLRLMFSKCYFERHLELWTEEANSFTVEDDKLCYRLPFQANYAALLVQRQVRKFLAVLKSFAPGTGVFYIMAKERFEASQALNSIV